MKKLKGTAMIFIYLLVATSLTHTLFNLSLASSFFYNVFIIGFITTVVKYVNTTVVKYVNINITKEEVDDIENEK